MKAEAEEANKQRDSFSIQGPVTTVLHNTPGRRDQACFPLTFLRHTCWRPHSHLDLHILLGLTSSLPFQMPPFSPLDLIIHPGPEARATCSCFTLHPSQITLRCPPTHIYTLIHKSFSERIILDARAQKMKTWGFTSPPLDFHV